MECAGALRFAAKLDHQPDGVPGSVQECVLRGVWRTRACTDKCRSVLAWGFRRRKRGIRIEGGELLKRSVTGSLENLIQTPAWPADWAHLLRKWERTSAHTIAKPREEPLFVSFDQDRAATDP